jgi:hypothetical protein
MSDEEFANYIDLVDKRLYLKENIVKVGKLTNEDTYYTDISHILYKYYELIECE